MPRAPAAQHRNSPLRAGGSTGANLRPGSYGHGRGGGYAYDEVAKALAQIPEVVNLHYTTGAYSMFLKIICRDTQHLREVLHDKIQRIKGIQRTETLLSLEESFDRALDLQIRKQK